MIHTDEAAGTRAGRAPITGNSRTRPCGCQCIASARGSRSSMMNRSPSNSRSPRRRCGISFIWMTVAVTVLAAMASLAVDYGRVQVAKTQLREAADAAARAGASALGSVNNVQDLAAQLAASNTCDGSSVSIDKTQDVEFGDWDPTARTFTVLSGANRNYADSVRITCRRTVARGNPIPLM